MSYTHEITDAMVARARRSGPVWRGFPSGAGGRVEPLAAIKELQAAVSPMEASIEDFAELLAQMSAIQGPISLFVSGNLGHDAGVSSDGVLFGKLTAANPTKFFLQTHGLAPLACADDGGAYTWETTAAGNATANDMNLLPAVPAEDDAYYWSSPDGTKKPTALWLLIGTQGVGTWTITWEYSKGNGVWGALQNVTDGTTGFTATTGWKKVSFDLPGDIALDTVDGQSGYWIRARVSAYTAVTTPPLGSRSYVVVASADAAWTDDTTDFTDADAGDVALLPAYTGILVPNDACYIVDTAKFCKVKLTVSQALQGTITITPEYSKAGNTWGALTLKDNSSGFTAGASTYMMSFDPPADWATTTINGQAGYAIRWRVSAVTVYTTQPLATQGWIYRLTAGEGLRLRYGGVIDRVQMTAQTASGVAGDSVFLLLNRTKGTAASFTWTGGDTRDEVDDLGLEVEADDEIVLVQVAEDGTTEFASATFLFDEVAAA